MNTIFKYNANAKYSTTDLKGVNNSIKFSFLNIYLDEKGPSVKTHLSNIIVAKPSTTAVGYEEWPFSSTLWMKFYEILDEKSW